MGEAEGAEVEENDRGQDGGEAGRGGESGHKNQGWVSGADLGAEPVDDATAPGFDEEGIAAFDEEADLGFGAGVAEEEAAAGGADFGFGFLEEVGDAVEFLEGTFFADFEIGDDLREAGPGLGEFGEGFTGLLEDAEDLEGGDEAIAGGAVIAEDHVAALFAAQIVAVAEHFIDDMFITDGGADEGTAGGLEGDFEAGVAHDGGDDGLVVELA